VQAIPLSILLLALLTTAVQARDQSYSVLIQS
jgi:hypothetical protein